MDVSHSGRPRRARFAPRPHVANVVSVAVATLVLAFSLLRHTVPAQPPPAANRIPLGPQPPLHSSPPSPPPSSPSSSPPPSPSPSSSPPPCIAPLSPLPLLETPPPIRILHQRAILMSCPVGPSHTHHGPWKPANMARGVEAVVHQLISHGSSLPLYFAYYRREKSVAEPFCLALANRFINLQSIHCFQLPDRYPTGMYGYAKIAAIRRVPVEEVLWLDCDVFPLRDLTPLFNDPHYRHTGAMFWPDSRDNFDEYELSKALHSKALRTKFPVHAWYVRQGFDTGLVLLNRTAMYHHLRTLHRVSLSKQHERLRRLSMGDKDLFHLVWMMLSSNFTMVPFAGETGRFEKAHRFVTRIYEGVPIEERREVSNWVMSSQVKFGRDGIAYALHQLQRQFRPTPTFGSTFARASLSMEYALDVEETLHNTFHSSEKPVNANQHMKPLSNPQRLAPYIIPQFLARKDLRVGGAPPPTDVTRRREGDFVRNMQSTLLRDDNLNLREMTHGRIISHESGVVAEKASGWLLQTVTRLDRLWMGGGEVHEAAKRILDAYLRGVADGRASSAAGVGRRRLGIVVNYCTAPLPRHGMCDVVLGPYVFTPMLMRQLEDDVRADRRDRGEIQLTSAMECVLEMEGLRAVRLDGEALDTGNPVEYVRTIARLAE